MRALLKDPGAFYDAKERPSEHSISSAFGTDNGGAIPSNLLQIANTDSNSHYLRTCRQLGVRSHPARFPAALPRFFIDFLTKPGDLVVDLFSGSNTTGMVAELSGRRWLSFELDRSYAALSIVRFLEGQDPRTAAALYESAALNEVTLPTDMMRVAEAVASARSKEAVDAAEVVEVLRARAERLPTGSEETDGALKVAIVNQRAASAAARAAGKGAEIARAAHAAAARSS
jgi:site-specific DNA-methyltransferase (cytosine-N4-specific)